MIEALPDGVVASLVGISVDGHLKNGGMGERRGHRKGGFSYLRAVPKLVRENKENLSVGRHLKMQEKSAVRLQSGRVSVPLAAAAKAPSNEP